VQRDRRAIGLKKISALLISLGPELSAKVLKLMSDEEIEVITAEVANTSRVAPEFKAQVLTELDEMRQAQNYMLEGGIKYARDMLDKALGAARSTDILRKLAETSEVKPFAFAKKVGAKQLAGFISEEHPQTIALILSYIEPEQGAAILSLLENDTRADVAKRIATMEKVSPEVLAELEQVLTSRFSNISEYDFAAAGGIKSLVNILNRVDRATEKLIFERLEREDPNLAEEIRKRLFVFEDIIMLDDSAIQRVVREVDNKDLALALKGANAEVSARIYKNISKRAAEMLREDMEFLGPVRLRELEEAQQRIVGIIRKLDESGEIIIARGGDDAIIV
jgi:flagellar motor switch protein FliG